MDTYRISNAFISEMILNKNSACSSAVIDNHFSFGLVFLLAVSFYWMANKKGKTKALSH